MKFEFVKISLASLLLSASCCVNAELITGTISDLPESGANGTGSFYWGDGSNDLFQEWSTNTIYQEGSGKNFGWFYSSDYQNSNADVYVYSGLEDLSTVTDASSFSYTETGAIRAGEGDTVFFRGTNDYYGAWKIDDIYANPVSGAFPYTYLSGQWYFQDDGTGNFSEIPLMMDPDKIFLVSDFSGATPLDNWDVDGNGTVEVVSSPDESGANVMQMTVEDISATTVPISSSILIDIPNDPFTIDFDYLFQTQTGSLEVWLMDELLETFFAIDTYNINATDLFSASLLVDNQALLSLDQALLKFSLYPGSPAEVSIGSIVLNTTLVPEPSTLAIFALGLMGLASRRFKKQA